MKARRMVIKGQVQGVGFRWWVARQASTPALDGSVRNRPDGSVEVVASGQDSALEQLEALCREGPAGARVVSVESEVCQAPDEKGFRIAPNI